MSATDTILALSTPPGRSGIGVIRLSGVRSLEITRCLIRDQLFAPEPNHTTLKNLRDPETGEVLDQALVTYFKSPRSFTGEDVVELSCHGSPVLLRNIIDTLLVFDVRLAAPGEFTLRALANGRLNLSQAEAVRDLINAQTVVAVRQAARQLRGELSAYLQPIKDALLDIIVTLESRLEFVEDDLPEVASDELVTKFSGLVSRVETLATTFRTGKLLREGFKVTLAGRPNVGKSSLFNSLIAADRAIVTDLPGTTRDSLSELISIQGIPILLTDTAGVRVTMDKIENLGVERTRRAIADADLTIVVVDGASPLSEEDQEVLGEIQNLPHLIAFNKSDLDSFMPGRFRYYTDQLMGTVNVSAQTGTGIDALRSAILKPFMGFDTDDPGLLITDARHYDLLQRTHAALWSSTALLRERSSEELVLVGLYDALHSLGQITGETTPDDILGQIFSTFCIGK